MAYKNTGGLASFVLFDTANPANVSTSDLVLSLSPNFGTVVPNEEES